MAHRREIGFFYAAEIEDLRAILTRTLAGVPGSEAYRLHQHPLTTSPQEFGLLPELLAAGVFNTPVLLNDRVNYDANFDVGTSDSSGSGDGIYIIKFQYGETEAYNDSYSSGY